MLTFLYIKSRIKNIEKKLLAQLNTVAQLNTGSGIGTRKVKNSLYVCVCVCVSHSTEELNFQMIGSYEQTKKCVRIKFDTQNI